jgi:hypothetical protein
MNNLHINPWHYPRIDLAKPSLDSLDIVLSNSIALFAHQRFGKRDDIEGFDKKNVNAYSTRADIQPR